MVALLFWIIALFSVTPGSPIPPGQCEATGGDYGFAIVDDGTQGGIYDWSKVSPDGRFRVSGRLDEVVVQPVDADSPALTLTERQDYTYERYYQWAPQGSRLLMLPNIAQFETESDLLIYDFGAQVDDYLLYTLPPQGEGYYENAFWSPTGDYLLTWQGQGEQSAFILWDVVAAQPIVELPPLRTVSSLVWTPSGEWVAYTFDRATLLGDDTTRFTHHVVLASTSGEVRAFELPEAARWCGVPILAWSPDATSVSVTGMNCERTRIVVSFLSHDNAVEPQYITLPNENWTQIWINGVNWAADSSAVYVASTLTSNDAVTQSLHAFQQEENAAELVHTFDRPLSLPLDYEPERWELTAPVAVYDDHADGTHSLRIMQLNTSNDHILVDRVDDMGDPHWNPNGSRLAVVHAQGTGLNRAMTLQVFDPTAPDIPITVQNAALSDIRHLRWSPDGERLLFQGYLRDGETFNAYLLDTLSGELIPLVENAIGWHPMLYGFDESLVYLHWQDADGTWHDTRFDGTGERVMDYIVAGDLPLFRASYFPAEDAYALLLLEHSNRQRIVIGDAETDAVTARTETFMSLGDPVWSPDGTMLAFTYLTEQDAPTMLQIISRDGTLLWEGVWSISVQSLWLPC